MACGGEPPGCQNFQLSLYFYGKLLTLEYVLKYQVILFDVGSAAVKMNEWKQEL